MMIFNKLLSQGQGLSPVLLKRAATLELGWDVRQKSRFDATDSTGQGVAVFLPRGQVVRGGDVLVAHDGALLCVVAKPQPVMVVRACAEHGSPLDVMRAAYHLGSRHVPLQLEPDALKFEPDHVLAAMLRRMHLIVTDELAAFEPEAAASAEASQAHAHHDHSHHDHPHHGHADHGHDATDDASHAGHDHAGHAAQEHVQGNGTFDQLPHDAATGIGHPDGAAPDRGN